MSWKEYFEDYDEGLGTVYERFMIDEYLKRLLSRYDIKKVLEAPVFGMTGVSGLNSIYFAGNKCAVVLIDNDKERIECIKKVWKEIDQNAEVIYLENFDKLPFKDNSFDMVWNFCAMENINEEKLVKEMFRVSSKLVLIITPNDMNIFNLSRKSKYKSLKNRFKDNLIEEGVLDIPPWPDTKISIKKKLKNDSKKWRWSIVDYLKGDEDIKNKAMRFSFIEKMPIPWKIK